jgi:hypothetical protein
MGIYFSDRRGGFIVDGNHIVLNFGREDGNILMTINKNIVASNAYQGIVYIVVSPQASEKIESPQESEIPIWTYEVIFTNTRRESFTIQFPIYHDDPKMGYAVLLNAGTELVHRLIWKI